MTKKNRIVRKSKSTCLASMRPLHALMGITLLGTLLFSGCSPKEAAEEAPTVTVQVGAAENQTIQHRVIADAVLYPKDQAAIVPKISAPVKKFYVDRGSRVRAGQLLAELSHPAPPLLASLRQLEPAAS